MKDILEFVLASFFALLILGAVRMLHRVNERILAERQALGLQIRSRYRFPLIPTKESEVERKRPSVWVWALIDLLVILVALIWIVFRPH